MTGIRGIRVPRGALAPQNPKSEKARPEMARKRRSTGLKPLDPHNAPRRVLRPL